MARTNWEADKMLDVYIYDYLVKRKLQATAKAFVSEGKVATDPVAIDAPGGFLFEWWSIFWDIFHSTSNATKSPSSASLDNNNSNPNNPNPMMLQHPPPGPGSDVSAVLVSKMMMQDRLRHPNSDHHLLDPNTRMALLSKSPPPNHSGPPPLPQQIHPRNQQLPINSPLVLTGPHSPDLEPIRPPSLRLLLLRSPSPSVAAPVVTVVGVRVGADRESGGRDEEAEFRVQLRRRCGTKRDSTGKQVVSIRLRPPAKKSSDAGIAAAPAILIMEIERSKSDAYYLYSKSAGALPAGCGTNRQLGTRLPYQHRRRRRRRRLSPLCVVPAEYDVTDGAHDHWSRRPSRRALANSLLLLRVWHEWRLLLGPFGLLCGPVSSTVN